MSAARTLDDAALDRLSARFARDPKGRKGHARWLSRYQASLNAVTSPEAHSQPVPLFEVAIVFREGRPDTVLTPAGVPEDEAVSIWRTYRDSVERAAGVVGVFPVAVSRAPITEDRS